jgi:hypothetical protein
MAGGTLYGVDPSQSAGFDEIKQEQLRILPTAAVISKVRPGRFVRPQLQLGEAGLSTVPVDVRPSKVHPRRRLLQALKARSKCRQRHRRKSLDKPRRHAR